MTICTLAQSTEQQFIGIFGSLSSDVVEIGEPLAVINGLTDPFGLDDPVVLFGNRFWICLLLLLER